MVQLGIAILIDDAAHNGARRLQLEIATACGRNPALHQTPHVTLKQPFHAKELDPVESYFDELAGSVVPFQVRLSGIDTFEGDRVVFLAVAPDPTLEALRQRVLGDLLERFGVRPRDIEDERYRFHATLGYSLADDVFPKARALLAGREVDLTFKARTLGLFYYTGELWVLYKRSAISDRGGADGVRS